MRPTVRPDNHAQQGRHSVLYLLRREAQDCLIGTIVTEGSVLRQPDQHRLFATMMVIFAGIDLLAKFAAGDDKIGQVRPRFVSFVTDYFLLTEADADVLWSVRNAMMHSFGLYDGKTGRKIAAARRCGRLGRTGAPVRQVDDYWLVCIDHLYRGFIRSIERYRRALRGSDRLQGNFAAMFDRYGYLTVQSG
jgi:hypothetical protein